LLLLLKGVGEAREQALGPVVCSGSIPLASTSARRRKAEEEKGGKEEAAEEPVATPHRSTSTSATEQQA
jgi:hypothetical protein